MKSRIAISILTLTAWVLTVSLAPTAMAGGEGYAESHIGKVPATGVADISYMWIALLALAVTMLVGYVAAKSFRGEQPVIEDHGHGSATHDESH